MQIVEFLGNMNSKRKVIMSLFWINRKVATTEGCEPFLIKKVVTEKNTYLAGEDQRINLSNVILEEILISIDYNKKVEITVNFGKELINISIDKNILSLSTKMNKELEYEIIKKLEIEGKKMYPTVCSKFPKRVGLINYP